MELKDFEKLVNDRQSCRDFSEKEVENEKLVNAINLALLSPSACNSQPWKIYCVSEKENLNKVAKCLQEGGRNAFTSKAKAFIVIAERNMPLKKDISEKFSEGHFVKYDIGEFIAYLTLALESEGLSSCIIGWVNKEELKKAVNYPDGETCNIVVAVGYSDIEKRKKVRLSSLETVKYL